MRVVQLDVLRAVAILLVLGRHMPECTGEQSQFVRAAASIWKHVGWTGVDLFFVLSGFLVSGLLFKEFRTHGNLNVKRFLIRRGFKIYPAFFLFLLIALPSTFARGNVYSSRQILVQILFLQNYLGFIWGHTWSLAVEEHFYLLLAAFCAARVFLRQEEAFRGLVFVLLSVCTLCLVLRIRNSCAAPYDQVTHMIPTHLRMDSLVFGVLLAYWYQFAPDSLDFARKHRLLVTACCLLLLAPCSVLPPSHYLIHTVGLTLVYLGYGGLLLVALHVELPEKGIAAGWWRGLGFIGMQSYSIYLWHISVRSGVDLLTRSIWGASPPWEWIMSGYVVGSIAFGILAAKCLEAPLLRLRDKLFPSRTVLRGSEACAYPDQGLRVATEAVAP